MVDSNDVADAGRQLAQLRHILELVEQLAGTRSIPRPRDVALDDCARMSGFYADALPIVRRRFDALSGEIASWAGVGVAALLAAAAEKGDGSKAAAAALAVELRAGIEDLTELLGA
jgi:hypothetical protein